MNRVERCLVVAAVVCILAGFCVLLLGCSRINVETMEVQADGSYISRSASAWGSMVDMSEDFETSWMDRQSSTTVFEDRTGWGSKRTVDRESVADFFATFRFAAALYRAQRGDPSALTELIDGGQ